MNYEVNLSENFKKEAKKLQKKFPSLKLELAALFIALETKPTMGISLGNDIYKIRISILLKIKGKVKEQEYYLFKNYRTQCSSFFHLQQRGYR